MELLRSDNVVSDAAKAAGLTLEGLGITPDSLEAIAPPYLWRFRRTGQFAHRARDAEASLDAGLRRPCRFETGCDDAGRRSAPQRT